MADKNTIVEVAECNVREDGLCLLRTFRTLTPPDSQTKHCPECNLDKSFQEFYKDITAKDGFHGLCKDCTKAAINKARRTTEGRAKLRAYSKTAAFRKNLKRYRQSKKGQATLKAYWHSSEGKATLKRYRKTPNGKIANYRCVQRHVKKHPQRARCHWRFSKAIQRGKIIRPKICSLCWLQNGTIEGHHPDYTKPFEVIWLCRKCHRGIAI